MWQVAFPTKIHENSTIHHLVVRPINIAERSQWDTLMAKFSPKYELAACSTLNKIQPKITNLSINFVFLCLDP